MPLLAKTIEKNVRASCKLNTMIQNCNAIKTLFKKNIFEMTSRDYKVIGNVLFGIYKIGIDYFELTKDIKIMIVQYGYLRQKRKFNINTWYMSCSKFGCHYFNNLMSICKNVTSPFNHMYSEKESYRQVNYARGFINNDKPEIIKKWSKNSDSQTEDITFLLVFFGSLLISNKKFSITYDSRKYNNIPPILINVDNENIVPLCEKIIELIPDATIALERNLKPQNVLKTIKEQASSAFLDIDGNERFNLLKIFKNYDANSQLCKKTLSGFGYYTTSRNKIFYSLGIYENSRLKSYFCKKNMINKSIKNVYAFDFPRISIQNNFAIETHKIKLFFEYTKHIFENGYQISYPIPNLEQEIDNLIILNKIESLRSKKSYLNLFSACIIFVTNYTFFINKTETIQNINVFDDAKVLFKYISYLLLKSQKSFGDTVIKHKQTIVKRLTNAEPRFTYLTERELYKFVNQAKTNKDMLFAINELIDENILTEIVPLAQGIRRGPKGRMFFVNNRILDDISLA